MLCRTFHTWNEFRMLEMFTELSLGVAHVTSGADNTIRSITEVSILLTIPLVTCLL